MRMQLNRKLKRSYNRKRYYRIMRALGLRSVIRKKRPNYVKAPELHLAENVMNRDFQADAPNQKWCTDVTELRYGNGRKAYLSAMIDGYDDTYDDLLHSVRSYIRYYNNDRYTERLNGLSPNEYRRAA